MNATNETTASAKAPSAWANSYWNHNGRFQQLGDRVRELIPDSGEVPNKAKNRALEKYRKACNCYYDLFNNGLFNRAAEFRSVFGFSPLKLYANYWRGRREIDFENEEMNQRLNASLDAMIQAAAKEQGVTLEPDYAI